MIQLFYDPDDGRRVPILGAVGALQFDVVQYRLQTEYGVETRSEAGPWSLLRWVSPEMSKDELRGLILPGGAKLAQDAEGDPVILFPTDWTYRYFVSNHPKVPLLDVPFRRRQESPETTTALENAVSRP